MRACRWGLIPLLYLSVTLASVTSYQVSIQTRKPVHKVREEFISISIDPDVLLKNNYESDAVQRMLAMARALSPCFLRLAGPHTSQYHLPGQNLPANTSISESALEAVGRFARDAGLRLVLGVSATPRHLNGSWDNTEAKKLLALTDRLGLNIAVQMGFERLRSEPTTSGFTLGQDIAALARVFHQIPRYQDALVLGPDTSSPATAKQATRLTELLLATGSSLTAITWHPGPFTLHPSHDVEKLSDRAASAVDVLTVGRRQLFDITSRTPAARKPVWLGEVSSASVQGRFLDALMWTSRLGQAARLGVDVVMMTPSQDTILNPSPEFWVSVLHRQLVGTGVLDTRLHPGADRRRVHVFAQCSRDGSDSGGVTVFAANYGPHDTSVEVRARWAAPNKHGMRRYLLTPEEGPLSRSILLNGKPLSLLPNGDVPLLEAELLPTYPGSSGINIYIPAGSIAFWEIPGAYAKACMPHRRKHDPQNVTPQKRRLSNRTKRDVVTPPTLDSIKAIKKQIESRMKLLQKSKLGNILNMNKPIHSGNGQVNDMLHKDETMRPGGTMFALLQESGEEYNSKTYSLEESRKRDSKEYPVGADIILEDIQTENTSEEKRKEKKLRIQQKYAEEIMSEMKEESEVLSPAELYFGHGELGAMEPRGQVQHLPELDADLYAAEYQAMGRGDKIEGVNMNPYMTPKSDMYPTDMHIMTSPYDMSIPYNTKLQQGMNPYDVHPSNQYGYGMTHEMPGSPMYEEDEIAQSYVEERPPYWKLKSKKNRKKILKYSKVPEYSPDEKFLDEEVNVVSPVTEPTSTLNGQNIEEMENEEILNENIQDEGYQNGNSESLNLEIIDVVTTKPDDQEANATNVEVLTETAAVKQEELTVHVTEKIVTNIPETSNKTESKLEDNQVSAPQESLSEGIDMTYTPTEFNPYQPLFTHHGVPQTEVLRKRRLAAKLKRKLVLNKEENEDSEKFDVLHPQMAKGNGEENSREQEEFGKIVNEEHDEVFNTQDEIFKREVDSNSNKFSHKHHMQHRSVMYPEEATTLMDNETDNLRDNDGSTDEKNKNFISTPVENSVGIEEEQNKVATENLPSVLEYPEPEKLQNESTETASAPIESTTGIDILKPLQQREFFFTPIPIILPKVTPLPTLKELIMKRDERLRLLREKIANERKSLRHKRQTGSDEGVIDVPDFPPAPKLTLPPGLYFPQAPTYAPGGNYRPGLPTIQPGRTFPPGPTFRPSGRTLPSMPIYAPRPMPTIAPLPQPTYAPRPQPTFPPMPTFAPVLRPSFAPIRRPTFAPGVRLTLPSGQYQPLMTLPSWPRPTLAPVQLEARQASRQGGLPLFGGLLRPNVSGIGQTGGGGINQILGGGSRPSLLPTLLTTFGRLVQRYDEPGSGQRPTLQPRPPIAGGITFRPITGGRTLPPIGGGITLPPNGGGRTVPPYGGGRTVPPSVRDKTIPPIDGGRTIPPIGGGVNFPPKRTTQAPYITPSPTNIPATKRPGYVRESKAGNAIEGLRAKIAERIASRRSRRQLEQYEIYSSHGVSSPVRGTLKTAYEPALEDFELKSYEPQNLPNKQHSTYEKESWHANTHKHSIAHDGIYNNYEITSYQSQRIPLPNRRYNDYDKESWDTDVHNSNNPEMHDNYAKPRSNNRYQHDEDFDVTRTKNRQYDSEAFKVNAWPSKVAETPQVGIREQSEGWEASLGGLQAPLKPGNKVIRKEPQPGDPIDDVVGMEDDWYNTRPEYDHRQETMPLQYKQRNSQPDEYEQSHFYGPDFYEKETWGEPSPSRPHYSPGEEKKLREPALGHGGETWEADTWSGHYSHSPRYARSTRVKRSMRDSSNENSLNYQFKKWDYDDDNSEINKIDTGSDLDKDKILIIALSKPKSTTERVITSTEEDMTTPKMSTQKPMIQQIGGVIQRFVIIPVFQGANRFISSLRGFFSSKPC